LDLGSWIWGLGFGVLDLGSWIWGLGFGVSGFGFGSWGFGFWIFLLLFACSHLSELPPVQSTSVFQVYSFAGREFTGANPEARRPNTERNPKTEDRNAELLVSRLVLRISGFGLLSYLGFRHSDLCCPNDLRVGLERPWGWSRLRDSSVDSRWSRNILAT